MKFSFVLTWVMLSVLVNIYSVILRWEILAFVFNSIIMIYKIPLNFKLSFHMS